MTTRRTRYVAGGFTREAGAAPAPVATNAAALLACNTRCGILMCHNVEAAADSARFKLTQSISTCIVASSMARSTTNVSIQPAHEYIPCARRHLRHVSFSGKSTSVNGWVLGVVYTASTCVACSSRAPRSVYCSFRTKPFSRTVQGGAAWPLGEHLCAVADAVQVMCVSVTQKPQAYCPAIYAYI